MRKPYRTLDDYADTLQIHALGFEAVFLQVLAHRGKDKSHNIQHDVLRVLDLFDRHRLLCDQIVNGYCNLLLVDSAKMEAKVSLDAVTRLLGFIAPMETHNAEFVVTSHNAYTAADITIKKETPEVEALMALCKKAAQDVQMKKHVVDVMKSMNLHTFGAERRQSIQYRCKNTQGQQRRRCFGHRQGR